MEQERGPALKLNYEEKKREEKEEEHEGEGGKEEWKDQSKKVKKEAREEVREMSQFQFRDSLYHFTPKRCSRK